MVEMTPDMQEKLGLQGFDFFNFDMHLNDKQRATRDKVRAFVNDTVLPNINPYWEKAEFPWEIAKKYPVLASSVDLWWVWISLN
jgi:alkylation response protein AidB-like acyl-CoA dehydrogenase